MPISADRFRSLDPAFVQEVATGLEDPEQIAKRYGYSKEEWEALSRHKGFVNEVNRIRAEMEKSGQTFRLKAAVMADMLLDNTYQAALDSSVPVKDKAAALQVLAKFADLEPKRDAQVSAGPGFSITINLPSIPSAPQAVEAEVVEDREPPADPQLTLDFGKAE